MLEQSKIVRSRLIEIDCVVFILQVAESLAVNKGKWRYQLFASQ